jgi:DNA-binding PadR family transcriptional regulator
VSGGRLGRFGETATWVLVALGEGPHNVVRLLDRVRELDGRVGPGTFYGAVARLERMAVIEATTNGNGRRAYRLTDGGSASADAARGGTRHSARSSRR